LIWRLEKGSYRPGLESALNLPGKENKDAQWLSQDVSAGRTYARFWREVFAGINQTFEKGCGWKGERGFRKPTMAQYKGSKRGGQKHPGLSL